MAEKDDRPGYSFDPGPPPEASRFLRNKGLQPSFSWQDVEPEEHAVAFAVAKAAHVDVLTAIREEVQRALDEGLPFREFRKSLQPRLEKLGWWGHGEALDPRDGQRRPARLGTPRRLRTIYDANLRSARAAGQWERIERTKDALPYLEYRLGPSERHRPHHEAKEGLVLPADDPFWAQWYPPNGWGCKCWVRQLTRGQAEERGIGESPPVPTREWRNARTGEIKQVPVGIDPGWERNPGRLRQEAVENLLADKLSAASPEVARVAVRDITRSWMMQRMHEEGYTARVPVAVLPADVSAAVGAEYGVARLDARTARKIGRRHPEVRPESFAMLEEMIETGTIQKQDATHLRVLSRDALPWVAVFEVLADGTYLKLSTFFRFGKDRWHTGMRSDFEVLRE